MASAIFPQSAAIPNHQFKACLCPICISKELLIEFVIIAKGNRYEGIEALE